MQITGKGVKKKKIRPPKINKWDLIRGQHVQSRLFLDFVKQTKALQCCVQCKHKITCYGGGSRLCGRWLGRVCLQVGWDETRRYRWDLNKIALVHSALCCDEVGAIRPIGMHRNTSPSILLISICSVFHESHASPSCFQRLLCKAFVDLCSEWTVNGNLWWKTGFGQL